MNVKDNKGRGDGSTESLDHVRTTLAENKLATYLEV